MNAVLRLVQEFPLIVEVVGPVADAAGEIEGEQHLAKE